MTEDKKEGNAPATGERRGDHAAELTGAPKRHKDAEREPDNEQELNDAVTRAEELQKNLAAKEQELGELKDKYLRALAEAENTRKRIRQQADETVRLQREEMLREMLAIVDNLERAVAAAQGGGNGKPIVEGVEMVLRSMVDFLRAHGVTPLDAVGQSFDPLRHEAVDQIESDRHQPNTVVKEFARGYQIGDRLLRPARVTVAKAPAEGEEKPATVGGKGNSGGEEGGSK